MSATGVEKFADAVLYEGYNLYPYRPSALKNRHRWLFGCLLPKTWCELRPDGERWDMQTQCLMAGAPESRVDVRVRFLRLATPLGGQSRRSHGEPIRQPWREPVECCVGETFRVGELLDHARGFPVAAPVQQGDAGVNNPRSLAAHVRVHCAHCEGRSAPADLFRLTVRVENLTDLPQAATATRDEALLYALLSTHTILEAGDAEFLSLIDPPSRFREVTRSCQNIGTWPVLVGDSHRPSAMLSAPFILQDFPQMRSESPGDLFDGTEIDELLSLRIRTLTDDEKREAAAADGHTRRLLERTESLDDRLLKSLHGAMRSAGPSTDADPRFRPGDRVRLRPRRRADAFDLLLDGRTAVVASVERDFEDNVHLAVTIDDDPGSDLGAGGMPGHRFFFHSDEVEPLAEESP